MNVSSIDELAAGYRDGRWKPSDVVEAVHAALDGHDQPQAWICRVSLEDLRRRADELITLGDAGEVLPLFGVPFAVKDNIDVEGMPTTAGCPAFAYTPTQSATVVRRLLDAGAILVGKTNLDQFATGLVGTRSPYGACRNVHDGRFISGGSSSGSAVAVAAGLVTFALGTDTAGSGRVPAAFNGIVGLKPTRGRLSMTGVVPACRSLDCVSVFAGSVADAQRVADVAAAVDEADPYSRAADRPRALPEDAFRFGVPRTEQLEFFGDTEAARLFESAVARLEAVGGRRVEIDYEPFAQAAELLYGGPWVAERYAAVGAFVEAHADEVDPTVGAIIGKAGSITAADAYRGEYALRALRRVCERAWNEIDALIVPTTGTIYTLDEIAADPIGLNTNLGRYTNFMNLLDLCGLALPAGVRKDGPKRGLPFGVTLAAPAWADSLLAEIGRRFLDEPARAGAAADPRTVHLAVVGAHLSGMPLNGQLTSRGGRLLRSCRTAPVYRFFALAETTPPKPALTHVGPEHGGAAIELEVWALDVEAFGEVVALVPPPLAIGTVELEDGSTVKGFVAEPRALDGATEITHLGGWRAYIAQRAGH